MAVQPLSPDMTTSPEASQPPPQPVNLEPVAAVGVRITTEPSGKDAEQVGPQLIPAGDEVTVPVPAPLFVTVSVLTVGAVPVPLRITVCGLPEALSVNESVSVRVPEVEGLKVTEIGQTESAATVPPQLSVSPKSPVAAMALIVSAAVPGSNRFTV